MTDLSNQTLFNKLRNGEMVIIYDDLHTQVGTLAGIAEKVTPQTVNLMTKAGKGLICVCITEELAAAMELPLMVNDGLYPGSRPFTVSVDFVSTTTGISAFERADTIQAFTDGATRPEQFRRPGHIFPVISKDKGMLQRTGVAEAAVDLARLAGAQPAAYTCEILNENGEMAGLKEILQVAKTHHLSMVHMSSIMEMQKDKTLTSFTGVVQRGRAVGRKIGFPTANLAVELNEPLDMGVYGVTVGVQGTRYYGVMNVGVRPTFATEVREIHYEIHLLHFDETIYGSTLEVDVNFFVRSEIPFASVDQLIAQIKKDVEYVEGRFGVARTEAAAQPVHAYKATP